MTIKNRVNMADVCELAHILTIKECKRRKIKMDIETKNDGTRYTARTQRIFDGYYDLITNTLNV